MDDAVTIAVTPGWHKRTAQYGADFAEKAGPILQAAKERLLGQFRPGRNGRLDGLYRALGTLLTLDPSLRAEGLDTNEPLVMKIQPAGRIDPSVFLKITVIPGWELPAPDLLARVVLSSNNPPRLLRYLQQALAKPGSCLPAPAEAGENRQMCILQGEGLVTFAAGEGVIRVSLLSSDRHTSRQSLMSSYLQVTQGVPILGMADIRVAALDRSQDQASVFVTIPGRLVAPLMVVHRLAGAWDFILVAARDRPREIAVEAALAQEGYVWLGEYVLGLPWRLEVRSTRLALVLEESVRVTLDMDLTDHGTRLMELGLRPMPGHGMKTQDRVFDVGRLLSAVEPMGLLYYYQDGYDGSVEEMWPDGIGIARLLLQAPAAAWKTMASTMHVDHRSSRHMASLLAKGLGLSDLSWQFSTGGGGTLMEIAARPGVEGNLGASPLLKLRAWIASNRGLRAEACLLPGRLPCGPSKCSDELPFDDVARSEPDAVDPCWEQALSELRRLLGNMAWLHFPGIEGPKWYRHAIPLHTNLACASTDPRFAPDAAEIDQALLRFIEREGRLPRIRTERMRFAESQSDERQ